MAGKNPLLFLSLVVGMLVVACQREPSIETVYDVPEIVQPYIDRFEIEAANRGFDITVDSLIVTFETDLQGGDAVGLCRFASQQSPIPHIFLDTTSFNWRNNESHRETLVFHELGHCILERRQHNDNVLPNGNFASIMRSTGDLLYGGNLNAFKREYYLDELFNPGAAIPDWSIEFPTYNSVSAASRTPVFIEDFVDNRNNWVVRDADGIKSEIAGGRYIFETTSEISAFTRKFVDIDETRDFEIEAEVFIASGEQPAMIQWAGNDNRDLSYYGFTRDSVGLVGDWETGFSTLKELFFYNPGQPQKMTIRKIGSDYHLYFNEQYFDLMRYEPFSGRHLAFFVGGFTRMEVEYLYVNYLD